MGQPARHLKVVQIDEHGELQDGCPNCEALGHELSELLKKFRGQSRELGELRRDKHAEAEESPLWPRAIKHFQAWRVISKHPRCQWTHERFFLIEPFLKRYDDAMIERAIAGHCFDPFITRRKNGTQRHHNGWELLWKDQGHFEEACNKAPKP